jgi:hypothetical protein
VPPARGLTLHTAAERPDLDERADELTGEVWPEYNLHGDVLNVHWPMLDERFADFQFVLADAAEEIVAQGHMVPCRWDGTVGGLPEGIDEAVAGAFSASGPPNAACALAAEIRPAHQGRGPWEGVDRPRAARERRLRDPGRARAARRRPRARRGRLLGAQRLDGARGRVVGRYASAFRAAPPPEAEESETGAVCSARRRTSRQERPSLTSAGPPMTTAVATSTACRMIP